MEAPTGLTFIEPQTIIRMLSVNAGDTVADFGAGSGYFSFEFAQAVGPEGTVYALDVLPSALEAITGRAKVMGLTNIVAQRCNLERANGSGLGVSSVDWVVVKDVLMQNKDKAVILREVARILKSTGRALIVEWDPDEAIVGPERTLRIKPKEMKVLIDAAGLAIVEEPSVGGFHYSFVVEKKK
jgi:ubiquinone/menaquinone biosynthesis C-methylase UbiE